MPLTDVQDQAIYQHADNLIVIAGAGSGKTFVLVERYLALLEAHPDWPLNALVAITFTQKAAQEMRDRVRHHLQQQADRGEDERWAERLAAMDSARIDTIHGLCASILRANAAEAGVDPGFTVLDEIEAGVLLDGALDDVFRALDARDPVLALFAEYGEKPLRTDLRALAAGEFPELPADLFTFWLDQWVTDAHAEVKRFRQRIAAVERFTPLGTDSLSRRWQVCADLLDGVERQGGRQRIIDSIEIVEQIAALKMPGTPVKAWGEEGMAAKDALKSIRDLAKTLLVDIGAPPGTADQRAARLLPLWIALAERVKAAYRAAKDEAAALDFDDLETRTRDLLRDDAVRERYLGAEFKHVLVDEFQDTNAAQWAIIQRIADPNLPGCLFVVGDPKQSIYGFRGADVSVFEQVRALIAARGRSVDLDTSFRAHRSLVECLNDLFAQILMRDPFGPVAEYEVAFGAMQAERIDAPCDAPALELLLLDKDKLKAAGDEETSAREWEARAIARRLKQIVEDERRPIFDGAQGITRAMDYGDAALLFQAMTHVTVYEDALKAEGIPYVTVAGKGYYDRQEVWDLLNLLRALYHPADNLSLAAALRSPLFSLSDDALLALRLIPGADGQPMPLWDALAQPDFVPADERERVEFARVTLRDLRRRAGRVTIAELLRAALDQTGYLAVLTGLPDGRRLRGNVEKLIDKAETSGRITLGAFTQYLKDMSETETREGEAALEAEGALRLMTVHKSKGLEFPLVALVDASYQRSGEAVGLISGLGCKVHDAEQNRLVSTFAVRRAERLARLREEAERRRLFYVAATRAQDFLLISGQVTCKETITARGWLERVIKALSLRDLTPSDSQIIARGWGALRVDFPPPSARGASDGARGIDWEAVPAAGDPPALLAAVPLSADAPARSLTATQIADLGSARYANPAESRAYFAARWRQSILHDAPGRIDPARLTTGAKVGDIVHRAVRWVLPDDDGDLRELLRRYAWEEGIVDEVENRRAVARAAALLQRVRGSDVFAWIDQAARSGQVYRELPFVYQVGERSIHGLIDLLLAGADGRWKLIDYKTNWLGASVTERGLRDHAARYHLQMGIYAAAVRELVGTPPLVYIHYIRYTQTITVGENDWQRALDQLEDYIADAAGHW